MKLLIVLPILLSLTIIAFAANVKDANPSLDGILKECIEETGASEEFAALVIKGDLDFEDEKGKCFVKCFSMKMGFCDANMKVANMDAWMIGKNGITKERVSLLLNQPIQGVTSSLFQAEESVEKCDALTGTDDCDTIFQRAACLLKELPELLDADTKDASMEHR